MNKLSVAKRATILSMLVEGSSLRSISRVTGASINTVTKLLVDAGNACADFHDQNVRGVKSERIQADEIWQFVYAKARNVDKAKKAPAGAGDAWTWTAIDADSKLVVSWLLGPRDSQSAHEFMMDLAGRLDVTETSIPVQLTTDGLQIYEAAVRAAFGTKADYAQLVKVFGDVSSRETAARYSPGECRGTFKRTIQGYPAPEHVSTSYVERHNLTMRMSMRRFTRLTNAFSKRVANLAHALSLYFVWYNWCRRHKTTRLTPAQAAGLTSTWHDMEWIVGLVDAAAPVPAKPGPKGPRKSK